MKSVFFGRPARQILRFGVVGGLATVVHALVGYLSVVLFDLTGQQANVVGFGIAWWVSFFGHHIFTFERLANRGPALARFVVHSLGLFLIASAMTTLIRSVHPGISDSFVPVLAAFTVPVLSFISSKFFVFRSAR